MFLKQEGTDIISFNSKLARVNIHPLITSSKKIERISKQNVDSHELSIDCPFPEDVFQLFATMSYQDNPDFKVQNVFKALCASSYFENYELKAKSMEYIRKKVDPHFTIKAFQDYLEQKWIYLDPFYEVFALDLHKYLIRNDFIDLPVNHLIKIFHRPEVKDLKPNELTEFVLKHLQTHKTPDAVKMLDFTTLDERSLVKIIDTLKRLNFKGHAFMVYNILKMRQEINENKEIKHEYLIDKKFTGKYFQGVFHELKEITHSKNLLLDGIVSFQASSNNPVKIVDPISRTKWNTSNMPNSSITFFLPEDSVTVTAYRIRSSDSYMPRGWKVEGSTDHGLTWYLIDEQKYCPDLTTKDACEVFQIDASYKESFNVIRVTQTQKNTDGTFHFCLRHFDVFGTILPSNEEFVFDRSIMYSSAALSTLYERGRLLAIASSNSPHLLLENARAESWESMEGDESPYILFDLKKSTVKLTGYTLRTANRKADTCHMRSWQLSAGNSLEAMSVLHKVKNSYDLNGPSIFHYYELKNPSLQPCRYIKIALTGKNTGGKNQIVLDSVELFGDLYTTLGEEKCLQ